MTFAWPWAPLLVLPLLGAAVLRELGLGGPRSRRLARSLARVTLLSTLGLALAQPSLSWRAARRERSLVAVDRSAGFDAAARTEAAAWVASTRDEASARGLPLSLVGFAALPGPLLPQGSDPVRWAAAGPEERRATEEPPPAERSRAASGVLAARAVLGPDDRGRLLLLLSPASELEGLGEAAEEAARAGLALEVRVLPSAPPPRARVLELSLPQEETSGPIEVRARVEALPGQEAVLWLDGRPVSRRPLGPGASASGAQALEFGPLVAEPGLHVVALTLSAPASPDGPPPPAPGPEATLRQGTVRVRARPRVAVAVTDPERSPARRAAQVQGFEVEALGAPALGERLAPGARAVEALVLDAATAGALSEEVARLVVARVEQGLGLLLEPGPGRPQEGASGEGARAWPALAGTPIGGLLGLEPLPEPPPMPPPPRPPPPPPPRPPPEPERPQPGPGLVAQREPEEAFPISLLLVLDRSASMRGERWAMAVEAAVRAADVLSGFDRVGVLTFAEDARMDLALGPVGGTGTVGLHLPQQAEGAGTNLVAALRLAAEVMRRERSPIRHVLLLTDGWHNPTGQRNESAIWSELVRPLDALQVTFTVVGLSYEHDERTLKELVKWARGGTYQAVFEPHQVPTVMVRDTVRVAEQRSKEARARIPTPPAPNAEPPQREPPEAAPPEPAPPEPGPPEPGPPAAPSPAGPEAPAEERLPLVVVVPHAATRGIPPEQWPHTGRPRRAALRPGASLLLRRGPDEPVLAAARPGLGRTLVFALPPGDAGFEAWPERARLYGQALEAIAAPRGAFGGSPGLQVLPGPDGELLHVRPGADGSAGPFTVRWASGGDERVLGTVEGPDPDPLPLPRPAPAPQGAPEPLAQVWLEQADGARVAAHAYLPAAAQAPAPEAARAEVARRLSRVPSPATDPRPARLPLLPWLLAFALGLLPLDAWLHRRPPSG